MTITANRNIIPTATTFSKKGTPMSNITLPMQPDYYKETMNAMFKQHGINPDLFEGYRVDSGADPNAPKPIPLENLSQVVKLTSPSANMPIEKFSDFGARRVIDRSYVTYVKNFYSNKEK